MGGDLPDVAGDVGEQHRESSSEERDRNSSAAVFQVEGMYFDSKPSCF